MLRFMRQINFSKIKTVHFIGIGGIGISAIARMFLYDGKKVSGSDMTESEVTEGLMKAGAVISIGEDARNIPPDCDLVIYTIAIPQEHVELTEAKKRGTTALSYPEALGVISKDKYTLAITGTHGKTTTTAMIAKILMDAGLDPTVIVGSLIKDAAGNRTNFIAGKSKYLVVEACEYKRSFLNIIPKILVITNIDADHLDYYKDLDDIESGFRELAAKVPKDGVVICDFSDARAKRAACLPPAGRRGGAGRRRGGERIIDFGKFVAKVPTLLAPGAHNKKNAAAALAVADFLGIDLEQARSALGGFMGAARRFELRGKAKNGALVYDDYGHHPTEIKATLAGARELFPLSSEGGSASGGNKGGGSGGLSPKIVVVFQPHLYSRTKDHLKAFGKCFKDSVATFAEAAKKAATLAGGSGVIITMGAGETNKVADILILPLPVVR
ncbi:MAG: UDP-N-acetylmuramate-L-alanine ligase [Parcubacteria group bacterium GW2011_GWA2_47_64]|nr:MAG: UDP-N-acetylmuramate-L-alanine ligase [Parcubacteria group bacterium GW2011_GWA2_47_64]